MSSPKTPKLFFYIIAFLLISIVFIKWQYNRYLFLPVDPENPQKIIFEVKSGQAVKTIASNLKKKQLIKNSWVFYFYIRQNNLGGKIKAGKTLLTRDLNIPEIIDLLTGNVKGDSVLVIPEGSSIKNIDHKIAELGLIETNEFINFNRQYSFADSKYSFLKNEKSLEGYLFPDTYFLSPDTFDLFNLTSMMLNNFQNRTKNLLPSPEKTFREIIIMASIIEREVRTDQDRAVISGILWKRLKNNWPLQTDATLLYEKNDNVITKKDLENNSPYNTRKFKGLPPTPICNPGEASIKAAINPENSDYWFYLTIPGSGEVIYSKTNEEHNENKKRYL